MANYKCPAVGDCKRADAGEVFTRSPGDDLRCPSCPAVLELQTSGRVSPPNKKWIAAAVAGAVVVVIGAGGGFFYKRSHPTADANQTAVIAPASASLDTAPAVAEAPTSAPVARVDGGISPSEADISAQRKDSDARLSQGDAAGAESASNQVAAKEMVKVAIAQMSQGKLDDAEKELNDAATRDPKQPLVYYNMAVLRLKQGRTDDALKQFEASFLNGFTYFDEMQKDPDLDGIRNDPRFTALVKKYRTTT